jgi:hypothetical protein
VALELEKIRKTGTLSRAPVDDTASLKHIIDRERKRVVVRFGRRLTASDIQKYVSWLVSSPLFQPDFCELVDLSGVEDLDLQADDFLALADQIDPYSPKAKRAFVAKNSVQNHAARMHQILRPEADIMIFHTIEEAEHWLDDADRWPAD